MTTRSTQLAAALVGSSWTDLYTVPSGKRTILKSIAISNAGAASGRAQVRLNPGGGYHFLCDTFALAMEGSFYLDRWIVLQAGDVVAAYGYISGMAVLLSGAELLVT